MPVDDPVVLVGVIVEVADGDDPFAVRDGSPDGVDARDEVAHVLPLMRPDGRRMIERWAGGESLSDIGRAEGIARPTVWLRIDAARSDVRRVVQGGERRSWGTPGAAADTRCGRGRGERRGDGSAADGTASYENRVFRPKKRHDALSHPCYDGLVDRQVGSPSRWRGGKNHSDGVAVNGCASEFCPRAKPPKSNVPSSEVLMAEYVHILLEKLVAATETNTAELRLIRSALAERAGPPAADGLPPETTGNPATPDARGDNGLPHGTPANPATPARSPGRRAKGGAGR